MMLAVFLRRSVGAGLLGDTDTAFLLLKLKERHNPLSWFWTDWPLKNHFYRPVSTLFFELDHALYGSNAAGFGLTQALIAVACVALCTWMVFELSESLAVACCAGALFGAWTAGLPVSSWLPGIAWVLAAVSLVGIFRGKGKFWCVLLAALALAFWASTSEPPFPISFRIVGWLPGRTASVMALFCLSAVAFYARYERLGATRKVVPLTSEDVPATRGTAVALWSADTLVRSGNSLSQSEMDVRAVPERKRVSALQSGTASPPSIRSWLAVGALVCMALALASYEQAVMLPVVLTGTAIFALARGMKPRWWVPVSSWAILVAYYLLRKAIIPSGNSRYQSQQLRFGPGVYQSLLDFSFPGLNHATTIGNSFDSFPYAYFAGAPWMAWMILLGNLALIILAWKSRQRWVFLAAWGMSLASFLPMAWVHMFEHYYFWPAAFYAWAVVVGAQVCLKAFVTAVSPPEIQAPPRTDPAPGSLPRQ